MNGAAMVNGLNFDERCLIGIALRDYAEKSRRKANAKGARALTERAKESRIEATRAAEAILRKIYNGIETT